MMNAMIDKLTEAVERQPRRVLVWLIGLFVVIWTAVPILVCGNLQLDLAEGLALGKEWQLGYWKHPPLPWWIDDLALRLTGAVGSVYALGPLSVAICLYIVWRFGREVTTATQALIAVLVLQGLHFFNFSAVKFSHDPLQLPVWALAGWTAYRAMSRRTSLDWIVAGAALALAFWTKYSAFALAATLGLVMLFDPAVRPVWRTRGPYLMAATFLIVLAPNLWWLVTHDFLPFQYATARASRAAHWWQYGTYPLLWAVSQLFFLLPPVLLLGLYFGFRRPKPVGGSTTFAMRYVAALAIGPFVVTTVTAIALGSKLVAMWGFPLWTFLPLAILMWFAPSVAPPLRIFSAVALVVFFVVPTLYAAVEVLEPLVRDRDKATYFPGREMARQITERWHAVTGKPLRYSGGIGSGFGPGEFAPNLLAVYSPDQPHVVAHGSLRLSPWVDAEDLRRSGVVIAWQQGGPATELPADIKAAYPAAQLQPSLVLPQKGLFTHRQVTVSYAFVPPAP